MAMKQSSVQRRVRAIYRELEAIEHQRYAPRGMGWCIDQLSWLYKWKHITQEEFDQLADRILELQEQGF